MGYIQRSQERQSGKRLEGRAVKGEKAETVQQKSGLNVISEAPVDQKGCGTGARWKGCGGCDGVEAFVTRFPDRVGGDVGLPTGLHKVIHLHSAGPLLSSGFLLTARGTIVTFLRRLPSQPRDQVTAAKHSRPFIPLLVDSFTLPLSITHIHYGWRKPRRQASPLLCPQPRHDR